MLSLYAAHGKSNPQASRKSGLLGDYVNNLYLLFIAQILIDRLGTQLTGTLNCKYTIN